MATVIPKLDEQAIANFREKFPMYNDMSDNILFSKLHEKFYSEFTVEEFQGKMNTKFSPTKQDLSPAGSGQF